MRNLTPYTDIDIEVLGGTRRVRGWQSATPGIVVHPGIGSCSQYFTVTHSASGLCLRHFPGRLAALSFARDIGECGSWLRTAHEIRGNRQLRAAYGRIVARHPDGHAPTERCPPDHRALYRQTSTTGEGR